MNDKHKRRRWVDVYKIIVTLSALIFGGIIIYRVITEGGYWLVGVLGGVLLALGGYRAYTIISYYRQVRNSPKNGSDEIRID